MSRLLLIIPTDTGAASLLHPSMSVSKMMTKDYAGLITMVRDCQQIALKLSTVGPDPLGGHLKLLPVYYQFAMF